MPNAGKVERGAANVAEEAGELDYDEQDLEDVFAHSNGMWRSWKDVVRWLESTGASARVVTPSKAAAMKEDFAQLEKDGVPFVRDARQVYDLTHNERYRHES